MLIPVSEGQFVPKNSSRSETLQELLSSPELKTGTDGKNGLSVDEVLSHNFVCGFAGEDMTTNTLT